MPDPHPRSSLPAALLLLAAGAVAGGCHLDLEGARCPCKPDSGYICCEGFCRSSCPAGEDPGATKADARADAIAEAPDAVDVDVGRASLRPGWVACGRSSCAIEADGLCCYDPREGTSACDPSNGAVCINGTLPSQPVTFVRCDSQDDCGAPYVCCLSFDYTFAETACVRAADCTSGPSDSTMRMEVCQPEVRRCAAGSCESTTVLFVPMPAIPALPPDLFVCVRSSSG